MSKERPLAAYQSVPRAADSRGERSSLARSHVPSGRGTWGTRWGEDPASTLPGGPPSIKRRVSGNSGIWVRVSPKKFIWPSPSSPRFRTAMSKNVRREPSNHGEATVPAFPSVGIGPSGPFHAGRSLKGGEANSRSFPPSFSKRASEASDIRRRLENGEKLRDASPLRRDSRRHIRGGPGL